MAEIYTISGADLVPFGAPASYPAALKTSGGGSSVSSPAARLQSALKALGNTAGNPQLSAVVVDGVIGPNTVKAVNLALANFIGATSAFPRADLTVLKVQQYAGALAALVEQRVTKSGGTVPEVIIRKAVARRAPSMPTGPEPSPDAPPDHKWVWYAVGGASALLLLVVAASAAKKKKDGDK